MTAESAEDVPLADHPDVNPTRGQWYDRSLAYLEDEVADHREALVADVDGQVLDLGCGTGTAFEQFPEEAEVHALDPERDYLAWATTKTDGVHLAAGQAESLPYSADTFDAVVCSQVLCSVDDVPTALDEIARVLCSDGRLHFLEHVHSDGVAGHVESVLTPLWKRVADGCRLNRDTLSRIEASPLTVTDVERLSLGRVPPTTHIRGAARQVDD
ncbi:class I SAM-dependent methyltransferase [Halobaculum sp. MBLA0147]|uniref:class I SAM-dependent methyltransferase n=1 Tax=Halobaculum sp. MBLA0147 TaxID=3079934 RepID=UPI003526042A